jgi:hypothetical protein
MSLGVRVVHVSASEAGAIARELAQAFGSTPERGPSGSNPVVVFYFVGSELDFPAIAEQLARAFPQSRTVGCTTCGEIGPMGCTSGQVVALALEPPARVEAIVLDDVRALKFEPAVAAVQQLNDRFGTADPRTRVLVTLTDGLSGAEELLLAATKTAAPGVALVGGSAADDFRFRATQVAVDGRAATGAAVLVMLEPQRPFVPFHLHHYARGATPVVVTEAEPGRRVVSRLNGFPAVPELIKIFAIDEAKLREEPASALARAVFGFSVGSSTFLRSVMAVQGDALLMGGVIEEGTLLYPMIGGDLVEATREGLARALRSVPDPQALLLFNCGGRLWEATTTGSTEALAEAMLPIAGVGFSTYGEQFGHVQVNHTLTGLVFGRPDV